MNQKPVVLVVDDEDDIRNLLRTFLTKRGFEVVEAANGRDAIELSSGEPVDLILMDLSMPHINGIEAATIIRGREQTSRVPIIFMTAYGELGIRLFVKSDLLGGAPIEYVTKPIDFDGLGKILSGWFMTHEER